MLSKKLNSSSNTKLSQTIAKINSEGEYEKKGFISSKKSYLLKTKSFRLREADLNNFINIVTHVNNNDTRMEFSESQVIRGIINYLSDNIDGNVKKIMPYIRTSS